MKKIFKKREPNSLAQHRKADNTDYNGYRHKQELREALVDEQRGICCYCMGRIHPTNSNMKIEHFLSYSKHPKLRLVYSNLFGSCLGNMKADADEHCDTFKKSKEFHFHMCNSGSIHSAIRYQNDGTVYSNNERLDQELNNVLNLNFPELKKVRKSTLTGFIDFYIKGLNGKLNKEKLGRYRSKWAGDSHKDHLQPYCMIVVYYIDKKMAAL